MIISIANIILIILMMCFIVYLSYIMSGMKYNFWYILMRALRHKDRKPLEWLMSNRYLLSVPPLMLSIFIIILTYVNQLKQGLISVRPGVAICAGVALWVCLIYYNKERDDKLKEYQNKDKN